MEIDWKDLKKEKNERQKLIMNEWKRNECQGGKRKNEKTLCNKRKDEMS